MKERVTLTLDTNILSEVDKSIDGVKIKNRSHAIEILLSTSLGVNRPKKALILAGGRTVKTKSGEEIPKAMTQLHNKPVLEHVIILMKKYNIKDIIISIGQKGDKIKEYFGNGSSFGVHINYSEEKIMLGTAGAIRLAKPILDSTFIVTNGDEVKNIDLDDMYSYHKKNNSIATIALTTIEDATDFGVVKLQGNKVVAFLDKPKKGEEAAQIINSGLYIFEPEIFNYINEGVGSLEKDIFPKLANDKKLYGYSFIGQWFDTTNQKRYDMAIKEWKGVN